MLQLIGHPGRNTLLVVTVAVAIAAWLGLAAFAEPFVGGAASSSDDFVSVRNARMANGMFTSADGGFPKSYAARIETLPEAGSLTYVDLSVVMCRAPTASATLNALGGPGVRKFLMRRGVSASEYDRWSAGRLGLLVGDGLAASCHWHVGETVSPPNALHPGGSMELQIVGIFHGEQPSEIAFAHYAYINGLGSMAGPEHVMLMQVEPKHPQEADVLAARIESLFAHSDPPVAASASATVQNALDQFGQVQLVLAWVMTGVFLSALVVLASVMAHTTAEQRRQLAVLQALGFRRRRLFSGLAIELLIVTSVGATVGIVIGFVELHALRSASHELAAMLGGLITPSWAWQLLPVGLLVLWAVALIVPAFTIARLRPTDCQGA